MVKRLLALAISIAFMFTVLAACGNSGTAPVASTAATTADTASSAAVEDSGKISGEVSFMTYRDDLLNSWWPDEFKKFNEKYPDIKIITSTSKNFDQDLKVKMASNDMPDLFTIMADRYSDAQRTQYMLPLDDAFPDLVQNWQGNGNNVNQDDKKTYGLTYGGQGIGLAYNKKIFADMGLQPPKTLDELVSTAQKIKAKGLIGFTGTFKPRWTMQPYYWTAQALMDNQTDTFNKMAASDAPFTMDTTYAKMMQVLVELKDAKIMEDDPASYDWEPYLKDAGSNKIGMAFTWTNTPCQWPGKGDGSMTLNDIGFVPFPYDNSGGPYKTLVQADWSLCLSKSAKNVDAAKAFYQWCMDDEYPAYIKETSTLSAKKGLVTDVPYLQEFNAANPVSLPADKIPAEFKTLMDKAQINFDDQYVDVATGTDIQKELDKMNAAWKKAKGG